MNITSYCFFIIPRLFNELYELLEFERKVEIELELVKIPKEKDYYRVTAKKGLRANLADEKYAKYKDKSFHLDNYCFDSNPENDLFWSLLNDERVDKVWFTGMLTHGQSDFTINYIDPESHTVRCYYPDFLVQLKDESYLILEVKGDNMIEDSIVKAKAEYAQQLASSSNMEYRMIRGTQAKEGLI